MGFLETAIVDGLLQPGERLPAQREVARRLGVDLTTVTRAFTEARQRGLIRTRGARGSFVAASRADLAPMVDLGMNIPPPPLGHDLGAMLREGLHQVLVRHDASVLMTYQHGGGGTAARAAGARWLEPLLGRTDAALTVLAPGAQAALAAAILSASANGDSVLVEPWVYPGLPAAARMLGRVVRAVATDAEGMRPDALEQALRAGARLLYLNPTLQNPTTHTMPAMRRAAIAALLERYDARLIEDDPYARLASHAPAPIARLAPRHTFYVSTLAKCLTPGLRLAFVRLPGATASDPFLAALHALSVMPSPLHGALLTQWIGSGLAEQLASAVREEARQRQRIARLCLSGATSTDQGIHLWHALPAPWTAPALMARARGEGLALMPSQAFQATLDTDDTPAALRLSLGAAADRHQLKTALERLRELMTHAP
nr:PLP-dependent aminotransferase family protein [Oleiagrimonas sp. C23AA]